MQFYDEDLKKVLTTELTISDRIDASDIQITVTSGIVKLSGTVKNYKTKTLTREMVSLVEGVNEVRDNLDINYSQIKLSDNQIAKRAENKILWDSQLNSLNIEVSVSDGVVKLVGDVDAYWKKVKAERLVEDIQGVEDVVNELFIVASDNISDEMIGQDIMDSLNRNINVDPSKVNVNIDKGKVTLTGEVESFLERESVYQAALYTNGVNEIQDKLKVKLV